LNSFSKSNLTALTFYLPYRTVTLHNLKGHLLLGADETDHKQTTVPVLQTGETNISEYILKLQTSSFFVSDNIIILHHIFWDVDATEEQQEEISRFVQVWNTVFINRRRKFKIKRPSFHVFVRKLHFQS
jgi:hypothetical protein